MGKGSKRRPKSISDQQLQDNWDRIFTANRKGADNGRDSKKQKQENTSRAS